MSQHVQQQSASRGRHEGSWGTRQRLGCSLLKLSVLIVMLLILHPVMAEGEVGEVVSVLGTAQVLREGQWQAIHSGDKVAARQLLRTGPGSRMAVQLANGTQLKINANSQLELKDISPRPQAFVSASAHTVRNILRILSGEVWIRNNGEPLQIQTLPATATIRGTEFDLAVPGDTARLVVLEGLVELANPQGEVVVAANEAATVRLGEAPRKTVLLHPTDAVQWSLYYPSASLPFGQPPEAVGPAGRATAPSPRDAHVRAAVHALTTGQPQRALRELEQTLALDPHDADARALQSNIYLVQNRKAAALRAARQAIRANPTSPSGYLALSAVQQANFQLESALSSARRATALDPDNPRARIQEARLLFGMGRTGEAYALTEGLLQRAPKDPVLESTWGFLLLARGRVGQAIVAFERAIALDSTLGEPHLGLGLARFRQNQTRAAVAEMRKASLLESKASLYQSYLGKAYYEVKNDALAGKYLARAKQLDPHDPTPFFYDAIRLQSINRPAEAFQELHHSIELNDNRAVYRSRLLLDEDRAARSAHLARIYDSLGFDRLAQLEASESLSLDPANYSAHRFLADSYTNRPRHEIARVSELLQAQLLQPANINPVQPSLAEASLITPSGAGIGLVSFNEYTSLFERDRSQWLTSALGGNHGTWGDEQLVSGITGPWSYSLGQFHYETDGFRENNDQRHDIYDAFAQFAATPTLSLQAEVRRRKLDEGDIRLKFDPDSYSQDDRRKLEQDTWRLGVHAIPIANDPLVAVFTHTDRDVDLDQVHSQGDGLTIAETSAIDGDDAQAQQLIRTGISDLILGLGVSSFQAYKRLDFSMGQLPVGTEKSNYTIDQKNAYVYSRFSAPRNADWTLGIAYDSFDDETVDLSELNYKAGLSWSVTPAVRLRAAAFETTKRQLTLDQTLEPTEIAGFNQFFDDPNGTKAKRYGLGLDATITDDLFAGIEFSSRNLEVPVEPVVLDGGRATEASFTWASRDEDWHRAYVNWAPNRALAFAAEVQYEDAETQQDISPQQVRTLILPIALTYHHPGGGFARLVTSYVQQEVRVARDTEEKDQDFVNVDLEFGYRLPKRRGIVSLAFRNLFDRHFGYEDLNFLRSEHRSDSRFIPDRTMFVGFTLAF